MEKYQVKVNTTTLNCDHISFEYSQQDSESSGRSENLTMYRDVLGLINKIYCGFDYKQGSELTSLLNIAKHVTSASVTYVDPEAGEVTKNMYVTCDKIEVLLINDVYIAQPFEMRFIQMDGDAV